MPKVCDGAKSNRCPYCGSTSTQVYRDIGDQKVAWCQTCYRVRYIRKPQPDRQRRTRR